MRARAALLALGAVGVGAAAGSGCGTTTDMPVRAPARQHAAAPAPAVVVQAGIDQVAADGGAPLRGLRVGLIAHRASVTADGQRSIDALLAHGVDVVRLFAPEHGLDGQAAAGASIADGKDPRTGLPIVSLYGAHTSPTAADLKGLDALVYDLQDDGVRFYTYGATELLAERAAAAAHVRFVVLDRPDPLGGVTVEGPVAQHPGGLTALTPGPLVNGLTAGELATYEQQHHGGTLTVVRMTGWTRSMTWAQTGRRWVPPSPNLRTAQAALLYPGTGLLEGTTATEGRGTSAPFLRIGAPWADGPALARALAGAPGVTATATTFVPASAPGAKFVGQLVHGVRLRVTDPAAVDPYALGLTVLRALRARAGFAWTSGIDTLAGTARVRTGLDAGAAVAKLLAQDAAGLARWRRQRAPALLYT